MVFQMGVFCLKLGYICHSELSFAVILSFLFSVILSFSEESHTFLSDVGVLSMRSFAYAQDDRSRRRLRKKQCRHFLSNRFINRKPNISYQRAFIFSAKIASLQTGAKRPYLLLITYYFLLFQPNAYRHNLLYKLSDSKC